jgi:multidrug efflux pump subunit AcrA (membrane-fusion protein)
MKKSTKILILTALIFSFTRTVVAQQFPPANVNVATAKMTSLAPVVWVSGTVVARIDDKQLSIQFKEERANVMNSQAHLRFLEAEVTRKKQLVKQELSPATKLDKTISERDIAKGDVIAALAH